MYPLGFLQVPIKKLPIAERYGGDHPTTRCSADQLHVQQQQYIHTCIGAVAHALSQLEAAPTSHDCSRQPLDFLSPIRYPLFPARIKVSINLAEQSF